MRSLLGLVLVLSGLCAGRAQAQDFYLGAQVGALGIGSSTGIGYGAHFGVNPYGWAAFQVDATFSGIDNGTYFSSSPAVVLYPVNYEEFQLGFIGGAGFYKYPAESVRFGLNIGATGDFKLANALSVGLEYRYHPVFGADQNVWTVLMTLRFHFQGNDW